MSLSDFCVLMRVRITNDPMRICAIIQLCLAFSLILWVVAEPFTGEHFTTRSSLLLFQTATGKGDRFVPADKLARHAKRFDMLDASQQRRILEGYRNLEEYASRPFLSKLVDSGKALFLHLSPFTQAWIFFSIVIALLLLLHISGAAAAAWLLPVITLFYVIDNQMHGVTPPTLADEALLPSEHELIAQYPAESLVASWQQYLIRSWAREAPSDDPQLFLEQVELGEHALTVARVERWMEQNHGLRDRPVRPTRKPWPLLAMFIAWNLTFAIGVNREPKRVTDNLPLQP